MEPVIHTSYLTSILSPRRLNATVREMCDRAVEAMSRTSFDAIAFCGMSGAGVAFPMSVSLGMPTIMVRKEDSSHHLNESYGASRYLEGALDVDSYLIVDDQISSGRTVVTMMARIAAHRHTARCVGILLYNSSWNGEFETPQWMTVTDSMRHLQIPAGGYPKVPVYGCRSEY